MNRENYPSKRDVIEVLERAKESSKNVQDLYQQIEMQDAKASILDVLLDDLGKYFSKQVSQGAEEKQLMRFWDEMTLLSNTKKAPAADQDSDGLDLQIMYEAGRRSGLDEYALGLIKAALSKANKLSVKQRHFVLPMNAKVDLLVLMANISKGILIFIAYAVALLVLYWLLFI
jgi:hypothetical protein